MTNLPTREKLEEMAEALYAEQVSNADNEGWDTSALEAFGEIAGMGTAANQEFAEAIGPDFICALDDGTVVAWGCDMVLGSGVIGRQLAFIAPADQVVSDD